MGSVILILHIGNGLMIGGHLNSKFYSIFLLTIYCFVGLHIFRSCFFCTKAYFPYLAIKFSRINNPVPVGSYTTAESIKEVEEIYINGHGIHFISNTGFVMLVCYSGLEPYLTK